MNFFSSVSQIFLGLVPRELSQLVLLNPQKEEEEAHTHCVWSGGNEASASSYPWQPDEDGDEERVRKKKQKKIFVRWSTGEGRGHVRPCIQLGQKDMRAHTAETGPGRTMLPGQDGGSFTRLGHLLYIPFSIIIIRRPILAFWWFRLARAANWRFSAQIWGLGVQKRGNRCDFAENPAFLNFKLLVFFMRIPYICTKSVGLHSTYAQNPRKTCCKR